jgi:predicted GIY-YIG superfamily endonuclease
MIVYTLRDKNLKPLYVGKTADIDMRLEQHRQDKAWYGAVAMVQTEVVDSPARAKERERELIATLQPAHNTYLTTGKTPKDRTQDKRPPDHRQPPAERAANARRHRPQRRLEPQRHHGESPHRVCPQPSPRTGGEAMIAIDLAAIRDWETGASDPAPDEATDTAALPGPWKMSISELDSWLSYYRTRLRGLPLGCGALTAAETAHRAEVEANINARHEARRHSRFNH